MKLTNSKFKASEYVISKDGKSIKCLNCGMTSHNPIDVRDRYCGNCHIFHERKKEDYEFSWLKIFKSAEKEDKENGIDLWLSNVPTAYRKRRINCPGDITIRHKRVSGAKTEHIKILEGECKAMLYIFDFLDCLIFVPIESIKRALMNHAFSVIPNKDQKTSLAVINLNDLKYLKIPIKKTEGQNFEKNFIGEK